MRPTVQIPEGLSRASIAPHYAEYMTVERKLAFRSAVEILEKECIEVESPDKCERCFLVPTVDIPAGDMVLIHEALELAEAMQFFWHAKMGESRSGNDDPEIFTIMPCRLNGSVLETIEEITNGLRKNPLRHAGGGVKS